MYHFWDTLTLASASAAVKHQLFQNMVMLHIKLKGMNCKTTYKQLFCITHTLVKRTPEWCQKVKAIFFLKIVMLHAQQHTRNKFVLKGTLGPWGGVKRAKQFFFLKVVMLHIKSKGVKHRITCKQIFCPYPGWGLRIKVFFFFADSSHVAYQMNRKGIKVFPKGPHHMTKVATTHMVTPFKISSRTR